MRLGRISGAILYVTLITACSPPSETSTAETKSGSAPPATSSSPAVVADKARTIPLNVQGVAPIGLTVRVKGIELGTDATILNVSASYGGTDTFNVPLASEPTYLQDEQGNKLMLKPPSDNPYLTIVRGQQLDGQLVFLGAAPANAKSLTLVLNNNNPGDSIIAPGLSIPIKLDDAGQ